MLQSLVLVTQYMINLYREDPRKLGSENKFTLTQNTFIKYLLGARNRLSDRDT